MRHQNMRGDLAVVFERALDLLIVDLEKKNLGKVSRPRKAADSSGVADSYAAADSNAAVDSARSKLQVEVLNVPPKEKVSESTVRVATRASSARRAVSASARREVVRRDGEQCSFIGVEGDRCPARDLLEIDHKHPRALGGSNDASNLRLLCRAHNHYEAENVFGRATVARAVAANRLQRRKKRVEKASEQAASFARMPGDRSV